MKKWFDNIDRWDYNCGGYALETYDWYLPYDRDEGYFYINELLDEAGELVTLAQLKYRILADFPELKLVSQQEVQDKLIDYHTYQIIAFRIELGGNCDFHFMKLGKNGSWYEKRGASYKIHRHSFNDVFDDCWNGRYNSEIIFFIRERI